MPVPDFTPFTGLLPSEGDPATFPPRAQALFEWFTVSGAPQLANMSTGIAGALEDMQEVYTQTNTAKVNAVAARGGSEAARTGSETARVGAETARQKSEEAQAKAELAAANSQTFAKYADSWSGPGLQAIGMTGDYPWQVIEIGPGDGPDAKRLQATASGYDGPQVASRGAAVWHPDWSKWIWVNRPTMWGLRSEAEVLKADQSSLAEGLANKADEVAVDAEVSRATLGERTILSMLQALHDSMLIQGITPGFLRPEFPTPIIGATGAPGIFDYAPGADFYYLNGAIYTSASKFIGALGSTWSSLAGTTTIGPWVSPDLSTWFSNLDFASDITGWTAYNGVISWDSGNGGQAVLSGDGFTGRAAASQMISPADGSLALRCLSISGTGARGTSTNSGQITGTTQGAAISSAIGGDSISTGDLTTVTPRYLNTNLGTGAYIGLVNTASEAEGTLFFSNVDVREARPFEVLPVGVNGIAVRVEFEAPEVLSSDIEMWAGEAHPTRDYIKLILRASDNHLGLIVRANNVDRADLDLGEIDLGAAHTVALISKNSLHAVSVDGAAVVKQTSGAGVGYAYMRFSDIHVSRLSLFEGHENLSWLITTTASGTGRLLLTAGDSGMDTSYGVSLFQNIADAVGVSVLNYAAGGSSMADIRTAITSLGDSYKNTTLVIWDMSKNGFTTVEDDLDLLAEIVAWKGDEDWVYIGPIVSRRPDGIVEPSTYNLSMKQIISDGKARFGAHHIVDPWPDLIALSDGSPADEADIAAGYLPRSIYNAADGAGIHMAAAANAAITAGALPLIEGVRLLVSGG